METCELRNSPQGENTPQNFIWKKVQNTNQPLHIEQKFALTGLILTYKALKKYISRMTNTNPIS